MISPEAEKPRAVIFDLDGTLLDSATDILAALRVALTKNAVEIPPEMDKSWIGPSISEILEIHLPETDAALRSRIVQTFRDEYDHSTLLNTAPFHGVPAVLEALHDRKIRLFVATNKPETATRRLVATHFPRMFEGLCCIDTVQDRKLTKTAIVRLLLEGHRLEASATWVVGDWISDITAARETGCQALGVSYGYGSPEALLRAGARSVFASPADISLWKDFQ